MSDLKERIAALSPEKRAQLLRQLRERRQSALTRITPQPRDGRHFPLSFEQERMWFIHQWDPGSPLYNTSVAICLTGHLDIPTLEHSLNQIIERHEALRTTFRLINLQPVQVIAPALALPLSIHDLRHVPDDERMAEFYRRARHDIRQPFDLESGPLLRATLFRLTDTHAVLLITLHHIIHDGWSMVLLVRELAAIYGALATSMRPLLPDVPVQYADFTVWQRSWLQDETLSALLNYWKKQLDGIPAVLELPFDRPRSAAQTMRGARLPFTMSRDVFTQLSAVSREAGVTLFTVMLAAFAAMLSRLSGQQDIVIGTPIINRNQPEVEHLIGLFMNTLALRIDVSNNPTFRDLLRRTWQTTLDAQAHQALPFAVLVSALQPERSLNHTPLFQVSFGFQDAPMEAAIGLPGLTMELLELRTLMQEEQLPPLDSGMTMFDLTFRLLEVRGGVGGWIEYRTDLFDEATVARIASWYTTLLAGCATNPDSRISDLPLLSPEERRLLVEWNATCAPYPNNCGWHALFEVQAAQTPDAIALAFQDQRWSYAELNYRANQLARYLRAAGVETESIAGICLERSPEMIMAILGVMKAGGAYLPLDPAYPAERLAFMLQDARPRIVLTTSALATRLPLNGIQTVCLDVEQATLARLKHNNLNTQIDPQCLAYIIYTSGSTGQPKGVMVEHGGLCNVAAAQRTLFGAGVGDRVVQFSSLNFDASIFEIVMALSVGATLHLGTRDALMPGLPLLQFLRDNAITHMTIPPSSLAALPVEELPALRVLCAAGEACSADLVAQWARGRRFFNLYGPTEATIWTTAFEGTDTGQDPPIGRPIGNTQVYVLDRYGQLAPIGVAGELVIGGAGVARGYLRRPDLSATRFIPNPFAPGRLYRSGDRARWRPDGRLEFLGRLDHQLKLRGFRIEPGEIEAVLRQHPAVRDALVTLRTDDDRPRLVAYYLPARPLPWRDLRAFLSARLPDYLLPAVGVPLDRWPLSPNGKIDRRALPAPADASVSDGYTPPRTPVEQTLADIWARVLRRARVGIHDNFFELGGDSIQSLQVAAAATQAGLPLTSRQIFEHQTIAALAPLVGARTVRAAQGLVSGAAPLTPVQRWFFAHEPPNPHHWNQAALFALPTPLDPAALRAALAAVLRQHDALRLRFAPAADGWRQRYVAPDDAALPLETVDLREVDAPARPALIAAHAAAAHASLHLTDGPLLRLVYFAPDRLLAVAHHLVIDGVSWSIVLSDLQRAYQQAGAGAAVDLGPKTTSYQEWAQRLVAYAQSAAAERAAAYWLALEGRALAPVPVDDAAGAARNLEGDARTLSLELDETTTHAILSEVPPVYNMRIDEILLAALALAYKRWSGQDALLVDIEGHGREPLFEEDGIDVSRTVGWFTCIYPALLQVRSDTAATLKHIKEQLRTVPMHGLGFGILRYLRDDEIARRLRRLPQAQISFNYLGRLVGGEWSLAPESAGSAYDPNTPRRHLIEVNGQLIGERLRLDWTYSPAVHADETIARLIREYHAALRAIIEHCQSPEAGGYTPSDFDEAHLSQEELDWLLNELGALANS